MASGFRDVSAYLCDIGPTCQLSEPHFLIYKRNALDWNLCVSLGGKFRDSASMQSWPNDSSFGLLSAKYSDTMMLVGSRWGYICEIAGCSSLCRSAIVVK